MNIQMSILHREQFILIYRASYLSLVSCMYALYRGHHLAIVPGSVFLSSVFYWQEPDYSYRRYLDMVVVHSALIYQQSIAWKYQYATPYYLVMTAAMVSYPVGVYYYTQKEYWTSTYAHLLVHILGNCANLILYSSNPSLGI